MSYQTLIKEATGVEDPVLLAEIEQVMRDESGGVLDHLSRAKFMRLAKASVAPARYLLSPAFKAELARISGQGSR
jgi:hypothetical protein